jgi:hypothetical protein
MRIENIKDWTDQRTAPELVAELGYDLADANNVKSALADAGQLIDIFRGAASLSVAKDFRPFIKRLWGLGANG